MKQITTLFVLLCIHSGTIAAVHIITCQNSPSHFLPLKVNARVGDTIRWVWVDGGHIVGPIKSTDIPKGAPTFNAPIDAGHTSFEYVVSIAGNYMYDCHPATPHGETASISVSGNTTGINQSNESGFHFFAFPNPSNGKFHIEVDESLLTGNTSIQVHNLSGQLIYRSAILKSDSYHELYTASNGVYLVSLRSGSNTLTRKLIIEQ
jgi:plastocyanin